jgi:3-oxoacyl-[acyl-carrier-protein] synthase-1
MNLYIKKHIRLSFDTLSAVADAYRALQIDYPKFFKMDGLSKLGIVASEMLLQDEENRFEPREDTAILGFNRSSSLEIDWQYQETIRSNDNYFPSPSLFVYTLPNIVLGEVAIRNKFLGETSFYVSEGFDAAQMVESSVNAFLDSSTKRVLLAWIEHCGETLEVLMALIDTQEGEMTLTEENLNKLYNN